MWFYIRRIFFFPSREADIKIARSCEKDVSVPAEDKSELQAKLYTFWPVFKCTFNPDPVNT